LVKLTIAPFRKRARRCLSRERALPKVTSFRAKAPEFELPNKAETFTPARAWLGGAVAELAPEIKSAA